MRFIDFNPFYRTRSYESINKIQIKKTPVVFYAFRMEGKQKMAGAKPPFCLTEKKNRKKHGLLI